MSELHANQPQESGMPAASSRQIIRTSGRGLPRVGARMRPLAESPRMISHEDGRVLSGQAMAAAKAQGIADHVYRDRRFVSALERYVAYHMRVAIAESDPRAHRDDIYLAVWKRLQQGTIPPKRGSQFWARRAEGVAVLWRKVWNEHVARLRRDAVVYPAVGCAPDEPLAVEVVDAMVASFGGA